MFASRLLSIVMFTLLAVCFARADDPTAAQLLPATTVGFVEVTQANQLLDAIVDHPLRQKVEALDQVRSAMQKKEFFDFKAGVAMIESQMGMPWRKILTQGLGGGVVLAVDAKTQGAALLIRAQDDTTQLQLIESLTNLLKLDAANKGNPNPVKTAEYRGIKVWRVDKARIGVFGRWLVAVNHDDFAKSIADAYLDRPANSLASNEQFSKAKSGIASNATAWAYFNSTVLRDAGVAKKLYEGKADNPLAELLFGGILSTLQHTPFITAALTTESQRATLTVTAPHDRKWAGESREYFFGPDGTGAAPPPVVAKDMLFALRAYRDISGMWLRGGDLFDEKTNEELAKADSNLSTLFAGKDFGEDILGAFGPEVQLIVTRREFAEKQQPAIKLPAFALLFQLKDAEKMQPELRRTFQSLVGFLNIVGAMNGQPQLELDMEKTDAMQLLSSTYLVDAKQVDPLGLKIQHNFSPSLALAGNRAVISSTKELARELVTAKPVEASATNELAVTNTDAKLNFDLVKTALADNRSQLVAQNMLQEGHTKDEAEKAIDTLLELIGWFDSQSLRLDTTADQLRLSVSVSVDAK